MMVWKHEGSGEYTVKSGYKILSTAHLQYHTYISSMNDNYKDFYKALWALNIPQKIKIHCWRLINDLLPHFGNLARRKLSVDVACPLCKADLEDTAHLVWSCDTLQRVWASLQVKVPPLEASLCCKRRFVRMFSATDEQQRRIITLSGWGIWHRRNKLIHEWGQIFHVRIFRVYSRV
ncbi:hypothetical protein PVK06_004773 [Gossypium arboreum]|uniref:Reverse transcriptase zinc-binding domain-containing protein n=1 Tax=Gossypium arboreum TaxID=29729 RepID=A0ABR0QT42_GOSAR|nr:hypothetical protein PVK06_004773 [Gossypium arboreum]